MAETREKPCVNCRRRKVRCDKNQPCSNCAKSQAQCLYDDQLESDGSSPLVLDRPTTIHLFERLSGLEKTIAKLVNSSTPSSSQGLPISAAEYGQARSSLDLEIIPVSPRMLPDHSFPFSLDQTLPAHVSPTRFPSLHESDMLIKLFLDLTEPFIRMLHTQMFQKQWQAYRAGSPPLYFEAMVPCIHALSIATISSSFILDFFKRSRDELLISLKADAETALLKADFMRTKQPIVLRALLYYITFLFETGDNEYASTLLGVAVRTALRIGIHKNQNGLSPFVCDMRRRMWLHLKHLDCRARDLLSTDSSLKHDWNADRPKHSFDEDWEAFRYPHEIFKGEPEFAIGFADTSYVIAREEIESVNDQIRVAGMSYNQIEAFIGQRQQQIWAQYLKSGSNTAAQRFIEALLRIRIAAVYLTARQPHHREAGEEFRGETFIKAVELLEAISILEADLEYVQYIWVLRSFIPVEAIVTVLVAFITCTRLKSSLDFQKRAWVQIDAVYARYDHVDCQLVKSSVFEPICELKEQAEEMSNRRRM